MLKVTKRRLLPVVCLLALLLVMSSGNNPQVARASGFVSYDMNWFGDCWYWDPVLQQEMGAAQYVYDNWRHTAADSTVRYFAPLTIYYSGVCSSDTSRMQWSADGWLMVVWTPYDVEVYNQYSQQVYP